MTKKADFKKIGEVINSFYKNYDLLKKETSLSLLDIWSSIVGNHISSNTKNIILKKNIIYIYIENPIIRNELIYQKSKIFKEFSEKFKNLKDVKFL